MLHDALDAIQYDPDLEYIAKRNILHTDDILLASQSSRNLRNMRDAIVNVGAKDGVELKVDKTHADKHVFDSISGRWSVY
eukprot:7275348-Pyramimonas_sp.AAC.1